MAATYDTRGDTTRVRVAFGILFGACGIWSRARLAHLRYEHPGLLVGGLRA